MGNKYRLPVEHPGLYMFDLVYCVSEWERERLKEDIETKFPHFSTYKDEGTNRLAVMGVHTNQLTDDEIEENIKQYISYLESVKMNDHSLLWNCGKLECHPPKEVILNGKQN